MKPPVEPIPSPPPSERCSSTTPIKASTSIRWMTITTCCIQNPSKSEPGRASARAAQAVHIGIRGGLYTIMRRFSTPEGLAVNCRNPKEIGRFQAGAADQGAVHVGDGQEFFGVGRLHRAAVEDAHAAPLGAEALCELLADEAMHLGDI